MRLFIIYTEYCLNKIRHEIKAGDIVFVNKSLRYKRISVYTNEFCISSLRSRLSFYSALMIVMKRYRITSVFFHNFTDYTFYMIYSMFRNEKVYFNYISDGIGTFFYHNLSLVRIFLFRVLFFFQFRRILVLPPFNFLACYNVCTYGFEDIKSLREIRFYSEHTSSDLQDILLIDQPNCNIINEFNILFGGRNYRRVDLKLHPLNLVITKSIITNSEVNIVSNVDANSYDLVFSFNSTILIELVQKNPDLKFVVIFQKDEDLADKNIERNYKLGFFDTWSKTICLENIICSNFNLNGCLSES